MMQALTIRCGRHAWRRDGQFACVPPSYIYIHIGSQHRVVDHVTEAAVFGGREGAAVIWRRVSVCLLESD